MGSRGNALAGVQGAEPPEAPGFSGFLRPKNTFPGIVFLSFYRQVLLQNQLINDMDDDHRPIGIQTGSYNVLDPSLTFFSGAQGGV